MKPKSILVVEDDDAVRQGLCDILQQAGWEVATAANGDEALNLFNARPISVVLTDLVMPGMSGPQLIAHIRIQDRKVPIVVLSAFGSHERHHEAASAGADKFLHKPIEPAALLLELDASLTDKRGES